MLLSDLPFANPLPVRAFLLIVPGSIFWSGSPFSSCHQHQITNMTGIKPVESKLKLFQNHQLKGWPYPSYLIFEINVGTRRILHRTTQNLNKVIFNRFLVDLEIQFQSRSMSDPCLSDIYFKNKMTLGLDYPLMARNRKWKILGIHPSHKG